jgi:hypothetical protein
MEARVGTLAVGALFDTLLTGRRGVVRAHGPEGALVELNGQIRGSFVKTLHPDVRVRVVEVTH